MTAWKYWWWSRMQRQFRMCGLYQRKASYLNLNLYLYLLIWVSCVMVGHQEYHLQALLVRERILGPAHPDTSYYIRYRGAVYADMGHFERCITLWMWVNHHYIRPWQELSVNWWLFRYALDMQQKILEPLSPMTQSSLLSFAELFSFMMSEGGRSRGQVRSRLIETSNHISDPQVPFANLGGGARAAADLPINENMNQSSPPPVSFADIMTVSWLSSLLHLFPFDKTGARSYSPCPGVQAGGARSEGGPNRPGGRGGQGRGLDVLQPHHRHPSPPRLPSHQAHTPPREGEGGANMIEIRLMRWGFHNRGTFSIE